MFRAESVPLALFTSVLLLMKIPNSSATEEMATADVWEKMERERITLSSFPGELTASIERLQ